MSEIGANSDSKIERLNVVEGETRWLIVLNRKLGLCLLLIIKPEK